jgi:hypothetical protein
MPLQVIGQAVWKELPDLFFVAIIAAIAFYVVKLFRIFYKTYLDSLS